jgi:uncharacterized protein YcfL
MNNLTTLLCAAGLGLLLGCSNTAGVQVSGNRAEEAKVEDHTTFSSLSVGPTTVDYANGLYRPRVAVVNKRKSTRNLQYRFTWYDAQGAQLQSPDSSWTPFMLYGKEETSLTALAPSDDVAGYRVHVRDLKANKTFKTNFFKLK